MIIVKNKQFKTPCYIYDIKQLHKNILAYKNILGNDIKLLYATMANPRIEILKELPKFNIGVFVNSLSHLNNSLFSNIPEQDINYAGSGHSKEIIEAISQKKISYCADSINQLKLIPQNSKMKLGLRINVGSLLNNSFDPAPRLGIDIEEIKEAIEFNPKISILHVYLGTNLEDSKKYLIALKELIRVSKDFPSIDTIDLGGGLAFSPNENPFIHDILLDIKNTWEKYKYSNLKLILEPGRAIVRSIATLYVKVTDVKIRNNTQYISVNTSGTWYPRKIIHNADDHFISLFNKTKNRNKMDSIITGSTTFSKDFLAELNFDRVEIGDIIQFKLTGAYCEAMHMDFLGIESPNIYFLDTKE